MSDVTNKFELALIKNNLSSLSEVERLNYYNTVCNSLGLNPLTQPFSYIEMNGKLVLYATRACTEQLRQNNHISLEITKREQVGDVYVVTAKATTKDGRHDESTGAVNIGGLKGDNLANALMKTETKAKRRVTLSICGLAFLDETELETIPASAFKPVSEASTFKEPLNKLDVFKKNESEETHNRPFDVPAIEHVYQFKKAAMFIDGKRESVAGRSIDEFDEDQLYNFANGMVAWAQKNQKPLTGDLKSDVEAVSAYLNSKQQ